MLNFYPYLQKYIAPHQRDVTQVLAALVQAAHDLVPPETLAPVLRQLVDQFVHDKWVWREGVEEGGGVAVHGEQREGVTCLKCRRPVQRRRGGRGLRVPDPKKLYIHRRAGGCRGRWEEGGARGVASSRVVECPLCPPLLAPRQTASALVGSV